MLCLRTPHRREDTHANASPSAVGHPTPSERAHLLLLVARPVGAVEERAAFFALPASCVVPTSRVRLLWRETGRKAERGEASHQMYI